MNTNKHIEAVFEKKVIISGKVTGVNSGDSIERLTINLSDGRSTTTDSNGDWSMVIERGDTVTVTPSGGDKYYGAIINPASKEVSGPDNTVDFTFSGYSLVADVNIEDYTDNDDMGEKACICAEILYDNSFVFITSEGSIHRFEGEPDGGSYGYEGKFGEYGSSDTDYNPPHYFKNPQDLLG